MLSDPLIAFYPAILLFYVNGLLCPSRFTCGQISACATNAVKIQLKITRLSNTIAVPPTIHVSTRSRGFIRLYQAGIIAVFPLTETVRGRSPKYGEQPSRIERFAAPDFSLPYR